jgi:hypothetical protein
MHRKLILESGEKNQFADFARSTSSNSHLAIDRHMCHHMSLAKRRLTDRSRDAYVARLVVGTTYSANRSVRLCLLKTTAPNLH